MPVKTLCPGCNTVVQVPDTLVGKSVRCGKCKTVLTVPAEAVECEALPDDRLQTSPVPPAAPRPARSVPRPRPAAPAPAVRKSSGVGWIIALTVGGVAAVFFFACAGSIGAWLFFGVQTASTSGPTSVLTEAPPPPVEIVPPVNPVPKPADLLPADPGPIPGKPPVAPPPPPPPAPPQPPPAPPFVPNFPPADPPGNPIIFDRGNQPPPPPPPAAKPRQPIPVPVIAFQPHAPKADKEEIPLSGTVDDATMGGGGRYWVMHLAGKRKLAIFDIQSGKVAKELPLAEEVVHFAAGATRLVVVYPNSKLLQIWNLTTFEKERSAPLPGTLSNDEIHQICMGSASEGPLFVYLPKEKDTLTLDLATLQTDEVHWTQWAPNNAYGPLHMRAAPDGRELIGWAGGWAGCAMATFDESGKQVDVQDKFEFSLGVFALPSADGQFIFTPWAIVKRDMTAAKVPDLKDAYIVPGEEPGFFLALRAGAGTELPMAGYDKESSVSLAGVKTVDVYSEDRKKLFSLPDCPELAAGSAMYWERRVHFYPHSGLLATLAGDKVVLRRTDLIEQMNKAGVDYLLVLSRPPAAKAGKGYSYKLDVRTNKGGAKVKLESGPDGLKVSPAGEVTWAVPADFDGPAPDVLVSLSDSSGQETFHSFQIQVAPK